MTRNELATSVRCTACDTLKPLTDFPVGRQRCHTCKRRGWLPRDYLGPVFEGTVCSRKFGAPPWKYPITVHQQRLIREAQRFMCPICRREDRRLVVDHRHDEEGYVRGLLCSECNCGVGMFQDNPERLRAAAAYCESPTLPMTRASVTGIS